MNNNSHRGKWRGSGPRGRSTVNMNWRGRPGFSPRLPFPGGPREFGYIRDRPDFRPGFREPEGPEFRGGPDFRRGPSYQNRNPKYSSDTLTEPRRPLAFPEIRGLNDEPILSSEEEQENSPSPLKPALKEPSPIRSPSIGPGPVLRNFSQPPPMTPPKEDVDLRQPPPFERNMVTNMSPWAVQAGGGSAPWLRNNQQPSPTFLPSPNQFNSPNFIKASPSPILRNTTPPITPIAVPPPILPATLQRPPPANIPSLLAVSATDLQSQPPPEPTKAAVAATTKTTTTTCNKEETSDKSKDSEGTFKVPQSKAAPRKFSSIEEEAEFVTKKLLSSLSAMDVDRLKQMINNPNVKYESVLKSRATKRIRSKMRKKLQNFQNNENLLESEECSKEHEKIPESVFYEIDRVLDMNMFDGTSHSDTESDVICLSDKDTDVLDQNLGLSHDPPDRIINPEDIFLRAEILLMGDSSMLDNPSSNASSVASTPIRRSPVRGDISDDSNSAKEPINFVSVDEIPILDIPLPEANPLPTPEEPLRELQKHKPIKFKLGGTRKEEKKIVSVLSDAEEPRVLRILSPEKSPRAGTPESPKKHKRKHKDKNRNENPEKVAIPRLKLRKEVPPKEDTPSAPKPRPIRPKSPVFTRSSSPEVVEVCQDKPKLDLKAKLLNLDAIKAGSIFSIAKNSREPSRTEILKSYRHIKSGRAESDSPKSQVSSYTPPRLSPPRPSVSPSNSVESYPSERDRDHYSKKKKRKKRRERSLTPEEPESPPRQKTPEPAPQQDLQVVPLNPSPTSLDAGDKQIIQISPKLNIEIKVLTPTPDPPVPELRTTSLFREIIPLRDLEEDLMNVAVISRSATYQTDLVADSSDSGCTPPLEDLHLAAQQPDDFYSVIEISPVNKQQELDNIIEEVKNASPEPEMFESLAQGLLDEIVQLESGGAKQTTAQCYEAIAQDLIDEVVKQTTEHYSPQQHFSPPQSISAYQSPASFHSQHSPSPMHVMHMSPGPFQPSPAHSIHSVHSVQSIYSPASCYNYPAHMSPHIRTSPRQTLAISSPDGATIAAPMNFVVLEDGTQLPADDMLNLSPEQVQQVASLHNTPCHAQSEKQDNANLMDEIVRNLMETTHQETSNSPLQYEECPHESVVDMLQSESSGSSTKEAYTSPIRNDVFLTQAPSTEPESLQPLPQIQQQAQTTESLEMEQFSPERLPDTFQELQILESTGGLSQAPTDQHPRMWRSPGEKKCMESPNETEDAVEVPLIGYGPNPPQPSPRDTDQYVAHSQSDIARMRDIDLQLLCSQKEVMAIDVLIQKLQNEKMEIQQRSFALQNERLSIMNQLMAMQGSESITMPPDPKISDIISRLGLPQEAEKLMAVDLEPRKTDRKSSSSKHRHESSSQKKSSRTRSRSRERREKDKKSTSERSDRDKKREKRDEKPREERSATKEPVSAPPTVEPTRPKAAPSPARVEMPRVEVMAEVPTAHEMDVSPIKTAPTPTTSLPKPSEEPSTSFQKPLDKQSQKSSSGLQKPSSSKPSSKTKSSFDDTIAKPTGKRMKDLKKTQIQASKAQEPIYQTISTPPHSESIPPILIRKTQIASSDEVMIVDQPETAKTVKKRKQKDDSAPMSAPKRRRKQPATDPPKRKGRPKKSLDVSAPVIDPSESTYPSQPRKRPGKVMRMMQSDVIELMDSPEIVNMPIEDTDGDETDSNLSLPSQFYIPALRDPTPEPPQDDGDQSDSSLEQKLALVNQKHCKIVLRKIDMERFLKNKSREQLGENAVISLPNSPEKEGSELGSSFEEGVPTGKVRLVNGETISEEDDFEGFVSSVESGENATWDGKIVGHDSGLLHLMVHQQYLIAASQSGKLYRYLWRSGKLEKTFSEHSKAATCFTMDDKSEFIYSVSLDGFMKIFKLEDFNISVNSVRISEQLQTIELAWDRAFIGTKNGRVLVYDTLTSKLESTPCLDLGKAVNVIKATEDRGKRVLLVVLAESSQIQIVDAKTGKQVRSFGLNNDSQHICSVSLDGERVHCGTSGSELVTFNIATGKEVGRNKCSDRIIRIRIFRDLIFAGSQDGFIHVFSRKDRHLAGKLHGPGKPLNDFVIVEQKIIAAAKDKSLKIWDISKDIFSVAPAKSATSNSSLTARTIKTSSEQS